MDIQKNLQQGMALHKQGKLESATKIYDAVLQISPDHPHTLHLYGLIEHQKNNPQVALEMITRALRNAPYCSLMHHDLGVIYRSTKQLIQAIRSFQTAIQIDPQQTISLELLGKCLVESSKFEQAEILFSKLVKQQPDNASFLSQLGDVQLHLKQFDEALRSFRESLEIQPENFQAQNKLGSVFWEQGKLKQAANAFQCAVNLNTKEGTSWSNLGAVLYELKQYPSAQTALEQAVKLNPDYAGAYYNYANVLKEFEKHEDAVIHYQRAIELCPDNADFRLNYVTVLNLLGQFEESASQCREIIRIDPGCTQAYYALFTFNAEHVTDDEVNKLNELLNDSEISDDVKKGAYYSLGKRYDKFEQYDKAFSCFETANRLDDRYDKFDHQKLIDFVDRIIESYRTHYKPLSQLQGSSSHKPIFILGMPRSGSTLIDQILTSHSQVNGAGEFGGIRSLQGTYLNLSPSPDDQSLSYPQSIQNITQEMLGQMSKYYLQALINTAGDAKRITDKMPNNSLHIGLICALFPKATIIYTGRNPLDICLSCFFQNFTTFHDFSFDLRNTGQFYREHARLVTFWQELLPNRIHTIDYEKLVTNQESETHRLVEEICGLPWEDNCLQFHQNKRAVKTASLWQVRQPMYQKSVSKWKKYADHLGPLLEELDMQDQFAA